MLTFTVSLATALGIAAAYAAITGILYAFAHQTRPSKQATQALAAGSSSASGD